MWIGSIISPARVGLSLEILECFNKYFIRFPMFFKSLYLKDQYFCLSSQFLSSPVTLPNLSSSIFNPSFSPQHIIMVKSLSIWETFSWLKVSYWYWSLSPSLHSQASGKISFMLVALRPMAPLFTIWVCIWHLSTLFHWTYPWPLSPPYDWISQWYLISLTSLLEILFDF